MLPPIRRLLLPKLFLLMTLVACTPAKKEFELGGYILPEGLTLQLVAREPMVIAPVALDFDLKGRMWVVEMQSYMLTVEGSGEVEPISRIMILEDEDGDGQMDSQRVFLDSLRAPRALCLAYGGLLYAEPPNLWFVEIDENDQPGKRTLVDSAYIQEGNIEHQPNGLMLAMDNWIYSARSNLRYRFNNGEWLRDYTAIRGQWGITQDNEGRLYYNDNATLLKGDRVLPQAALFNAFLRPQASMNQLLTDSQRVYPLFPSLVNRGYQPGVLDSSGRLVNATSACGPLIYRGNGLPQIYRGDAFVAIPEANLIKQLDIVVGEGGRKAQHVYRQDEFLRTTDPLFRPVNLYDGPDGALYIVDMHRGVIQHQAYMTSYLRDSILYQQLDTVLNQGRILKVTSSEQFPMDIPYLPHASPEQLVDLLNHPNGWMRDKVQHYLIYNRAEAAIPLLRKAVQNGQSPAALHAFWALEGMGEVDAELLQAAINRDDPVLVQHALYYTLFIQSDFDWREAYERQDIEIDRYLALALPHLLQDKEHMEEYWDTLYARNGADPVIAELVLSGGNESGLKWALETESAEHLAQSVQTAMRENQPNPMLVAAQHSIDNRTVGLRVYQQNCASCHGLDGAGQEGVAPSLQLSPIIRGDSTHLALVLLYGLHGPLQREGGIIEFPGQMPGFGGNSSLSDEDIAGLIAYLRNAFSTRRAYIPTPLVDSLRNMGRSFDQSYTEKELARLP